MTEESTIAWIFLAVDVTPSSLHEIVGNADAINHAIPTLQELRRALGWLITQGLVRKEERTYSLTEEGRGVRESVAVSRSLMKNWDILAERFATMINGTTDQDEISHEEIEWAYLQYRKRFQDAYRALSTKRRRKKP